jgi:hypothetical protein
LFEGRLGLGFERRFGERGGAFVAGAIEIVLNLNKAMLEFC